jgi:hypothetical protein
MISPIIAAALSKMNLGLHLIGVEDAALVKGTLEFNLFKIDDIKVVLRENTPIAVLNASDKQIELLSGQSRSSNIGQRIPPPSPATLGPPVEPRFDTSSSPIFTFATRSGRQRNYPRAWL